jgi:hypothetical protein
LVPGREFKLMEIVFCTCVLSTCEAALEGQMSVTNTYVVVAVNGEEAKASTSYATATSVAGRKVGERDEKGY